MHELYELKEKLMKELSEYSQNGKFSKEDAEVIKYLASAIDHICNIVMDMEDEEYSNEYRYSREQGGGNRGGQGGGSYRGGQGGNSRTGGSYAGGRYSRNSYARGRGRNARRDSMGRYSREGGVEELAQTLGEMMGELPEEVKRDAEKLMIKLDEMM